MRIHAWLTMPLLLVPALAAAQPQRSVGTVRGIVYDSLTRRPLRDAVIEVRETAQITYSDAQGRFTIDSVPLGPQQLTFSSPTLDSLGLYGFARDVDVTKDTRGVLLATPSFNTVYRRICPATERPSKDSAIVFGTVFDATSRAPLSKAQVSLAWLEPSDGGKELSNPERTAPTGDDGVYGICGVPADVALTTKARHDSIASSAITTVVGPARMLRRDLYLSRELNRPGSAVSSAGAGIVRGTVRDERGKALSGALVSLTAGNRTTETDADGQYRLVNVPLGTQALSVQQIGRQGISRIIDVTSREDGPHDIVLSRAATVLETMDVRAKGEHQLGFLRRKNQGFARVIERKEILKRQDIPSALNRMPGLRVTQTPLGPEVTGSRPVCNGPIPIVIDGVPLRPPGTADLGRNSKSTAPPAPPPNGAILERLQINDVMAMEYHPGAASVPTEYWPFALPSCGIVLVWTVLSRWEK
ncbi:MAG TPA: carboxypeptidase regulatory-like domain-containing protein [Gemmatimonas sp.]|uniref:carboxypeptidase regulatory-like domain-containing protein n=1 Tax=Gemmatimonas sp. TaxID=1962908 RepID=UPI002ED98706